MLTTPMTSVRAPSESWRVRRRQVKDARVSVFVNSLPACSPTAGVENGNGRFSLVSFGGAPGFRIHPNEQVHRDAQIRMQAANHRECQGALAGQYLRNAGSASDQRLKILAR